MLLVVVGEVIGSNLGINSIITKESKKVNTAARLNTVLDKSGRYPLTNFSVSKFQIL